MSANRTIDGVPRRLVEWMVNAGELIDLLGLDEGYLRDLLDTPACKACNDTKKMHEPGQEPGSCAACFEDQAASPRASRWRARMIG